MIRFLILSEHLFISSVSARIFINDIWTYYVNWFDFYQWNCVPTYWKILANKQILMIDTKRPQQTNWIFNSFIPLYVRHDDSHWIDDGLLIPKCDC